MHTFMHQRWIKGLKTGLLLLLLFNFLKDEDYIKPHIEKIQLLVEWPTDLFTLLFLVVAGLLVIDGQLFTKRGFVSVEEDALIVKKIDQPAMTIPYQRIAECKMDKVDGEMYQLRINGHTLNIRLNKEVREDFIDVMKKHAVEVIVPQGFRRFWSNWK